MSHTAAAHYFKDKPGLFTAYIERAWNQVADGLAGAASETDDRAALLAAGQVYAAFALANPAAFSVMSRLDLARVDTPSLWAARERGFFELAALVERCQRNGWAQESEVLDVMATTWGFVHGFVDLWMGGPLQAPFDGSDMVATLRRLLDDVLDGIDSVSSPPPATRGGETTK